MIAPVDLTDQELSVFAALLLALLFVASELGHWAGAMIRRERAPNDAAGTAIGFITGGLMTLFAFVLGIALSMASIRLEARRDSVLNEANAIGTVWLRAGLAGDPETQAIRHELREYIKVRIEAARDAVTDDAVAQAVARTGASQQIIWHQAETVAQRSPGPIAALLIGSINEMIDLSLTNRRNFSAHIPPVVRWLLLISSALSVGAMGYHFGLIGARHPVISALLLIVWTAAIVLVSDIDNSRGGLVRASAAPLVWTQASFGPDG